MVSNSWRASASSSSNQSWWRDLLNPMTVAAESNTADLNCGHSPMSSPAKASSSSSCRTRQVASSFSLATLNLFICSALCVRLAALLVRNTEVLTIRWSDQDVVARITRDNLMLQRSRCLVRTKSIRCQWLERGCIQLPSYLSACWKTVLVSTRLYVIQNSSSNEPFAFLLPIPWWPRILFHTLKSLPTLPFKSPIMNSWCLIGTVLVALLSWS